MELVVGQPVGVKDVDGVGQQEVGMEGFFIVERRDEGVAPVDAAVLVGGEARVLGVVLRKGGVGEVGPAAVFDKPYVGIVARLKTVSNDRRMLPLSLRSANR